jgi:hypothetical protein
LVVFATVNYCSQVVDINIGAKTTTRNLTENTEKYFLYGDITPSLVAGRWMLSFQVDGNKKMNSGLLTKEMEIYYSEKNSEISISTCLRGGFLKFAEKSANYIYNRTAGLLKNKEIIGSDMQLVVLTPGSEKSILIISVGDLKADYGIVDVDAPKTWPTFEVWTNI